MGHRLILGLCCVALCCSALACKKKDSLPPAAAQGTQDDPGANCADGGVAVSADDEKKPDASCSGVKSVVTCFGQWAAHCDADAKVEKLENCRKQDRVCKPGKCANGDCGGCVTCVPGSTQCGEHGERYECNADGSDFELAETCDESKGERCSLTDHKCENLCDAAAADHSYVGCEYWAAATLNSQLLMTSMDADGVCEPFPFAVAIGNTEGVTAHVTIEVAGAGKKTLEVAPNDVQLAELPCNVELKGDPHAMSASTRVKAAAHHIVSDVPVTAYQFNALEYEAKVMNEEAYSDTNDASLLLPVHALTGNYRVMSRATLTQQILPNDPTVKQFTQSLSGFVAIIGVEDKPTKVEITSSAHTVASADGKIPALAPGDPLVVMLEKGEVLQLVSAAPPDCVGDDYETHLAATVTFCDVSNDFDLTGTQIKSTGKISVIAGHDCAFVPFDRRACDHLEESMFPLESWGKDIFMTVSATTDCTVAPNAFRILSNSDGNNVRFVPDSVHDPITLDRGQYFELQSDRAFEIVADHAIAVGQYMLGQDYMGRGSSGSFYKGDPSMSLGIPIEQWRDRYSFLIPSTYQDNFVNVIAQTDQVILLDGKLVGGFAPVEGTERSVTKLPVAAGSHVITSDALFGITIYGLATYTSYMLPGGLDLNPIGSPD